MKVKRLELKGFRGFDEIVLDFDTNPQRPTVFIGNNGVGKSSILDALAILLSWFVKRIEFDPDSPDYIVIDKDNNYVMPKELILEGFSFFDGIKNNNDKASGKIIINYQSQDDFWELGSEGNYFFHQQTLNISNLNNLTHKIHEKKKSDIYYDLPIIVYYSINRLIEKIPLESENNLSKKSIDLYKNALAEEIYRNALDKKNFDFKTFFKWFREIEDLENEKIRDEADYRDKKLVAVRNSIYSLIPEFSNVRVKRDPLRLRMTVNKTIGDKVEELSINQLSDGEKCLLAMVGDIARRLAIANPSLDDPLQGEGIVLIDEIELHLHPQWQRKIIPDLTRTFPNCQFIVTTHSPQVLSHVYSENIYILQSTPDGIIASHPESSYGRDSNQILENVMGVSAYPEDIEKDLSELFRLIDRNDLQGAKKLRKDIGAKQEDRFDDPQIIKAGVIIKGKEILGK